MNLRKWHLYYQALLSAFVLLYKELTWKAILLLKHFFKMMIIVWREDYDTCTHSSDKIKFNILGKNNS